MSDLAIQNWTLETTKEVKPKKQKDIEVLELQTEDVEVL